MSQKRSLSPLLKLNFLLVRLFLEDGIEDDVVELKQDKVSQHVCVVWNVLQKLGQEVEEDFPIENILLCSDSNCLPEIFP